MSLRPIRVLELRSVRGTGGGPEKTILLGAARSDPRRVRVTVCYIRDARDDCFHIDARARALGIDYVEIVERNSFDRSIWPAIRRLVSEHAIDIVHAHDYKTNVIALLLARRAGIVPLSTVHGWTGSSPRETYLYYPADKRLLARFPLLIAVSSEIRSELLRTGARPERVRTILNGIDPQIFQRDRGREPEVRAAMGIGRGDVTIGAVGRLEAQKRFDLLLEAAAAVRRDRPELRLLLAGDGSLRLPLDAAASRLGLGAACRFVGHIDDVATFHHALDVCVQSSDYEGTPNAVLEAMAMETPVVATAVGGTAEMLKDGGLIVPPGDPQALAAAIERTIARRDETAQRVSVARFRVEQELSFEARMAAVETIYEELMAARLQTETRHRALQWA